MVGRRQKHPNAVCLLTYYGGEKAVSKHRESRVVVSGGYLDVERDSGTAPCGAEFGGGTAAFNLVQHTAQPPLRQLLQTHIRAPKGRRSK